MKRARTPRPKTQKAGDAAIFRLCREWKSQNARYKALCARSMEVSRKRDRFQAGAPKQLSEPFDILDETMRSSAHDRVWSADQLARFLRDPTTYRSNRIRADDDHMIIETKRVPIPKATLDHIRALHRIAKKWEAKRAPLDRKYKEADAVDQAQLDVCDHILRRIAAHRPKTVEGMKAMVAVAMQAGWRDGYPEAQQIVETVLKILASPLNAEGLAI